MKSVWQEETENPRFKTLKGDKTADVLIIGGGITGILCADAMEKAGIDYILLEGERILNKNTANTTAKITAGHGLIYSDIIKKSGLNAAKKYYYANLSAIENYKDLSLKYDCDFETKDFYVYSKNNLEKLKDEIKALKQIGADASLVYNMEIPIKAEGAIRYRNQAQFNPLKLLFAVAEKLNIYEHSFVKKVCRNTAITENGTVKAKKIIFATHFPIINRYGMYFLKMYQSRSFVIAMENAGRLENMYVDEDDSGFSFRSYKNYLLVSGAGGRTGTDTGGFNKVKSFCKSHYPKAVEKYRFAAQDCMSLDNLPYIGIYSYSKPNFFVATGFGKWGMTTALVASKLICDMILEKRNNLESVVSPQRSVFLPQLLTNSFEAVKNIFTPTVPRCPHMGCALKWNEYEKTWDCPCHGSRFDEKGNLLDNPSKRNKKL